MHLNHFQCRSGLAVVVSCLAMAHAVAGQGDSATELGRAQQCYDDGNYRQAAEILEHIVQGATRDTRGTSEIVGAARLLAQVYHHSADDAAAIRAAERYTQLWPEPDPEILLISADSHL